MKHKIMKRIFILYNIVALTGSPSAGFCRFLAFKRQSADQQWLRNS